MRGFMGGAPGFLDAEAKFEWPLLKRVARYFFPYWPHSLLTLGTIVGGAALGLVPALVTRTLIDHALRPGASFRTVVLVVAAGVAAALGEGGLGVLRAYLQNLIS